VYSTGMETWMLGIAEMPVYGLCRPAM